MALKWMTTTASMVLPLVALALGCGPGGGADDAMGTGEEVWGTDSSASGESTPANGGAVGPSGAAGNSSMASGAAGATDGSIGEGAAGTGGTTGNSTGASAAGGSEATSAGSGGTPGSVGGGGGATSAGGGGGATSAGAGGESGGNSDQGGAPSGGTGAPPVFDRPAPREDFTEELSGASFEMVYIPGGTFTLGCESSPCPADAEPVPGVTVSSYHLGKTEVTTELWSAVMGESSAGFGRPSITWYDAMRFACQLSQVTGRAYRMMTEAEFEYAAKHHAGSLEDLGSGEEWAYNSWSTTHAGGVDPVGPHSGEHTQKTRRDAQGTADNITGRLIRSIDGVGPGLRLAISAEMDFPPGMVPACDLHPPRMGDEPVNSYRDLRWVTGSDARWTTGSVAIGNFELRVWEDGTARLGKVDGQWFSSNNIAFVFVPSSGASIKFAYIFLDETRGSLISDQSFMNGGYIGRIVKESTSGSDKPSISGLKSGAELAAAAGDDYAMVDMVDIPESAKQQDPRLLDGAARGWFQDNRSAGGVHHYRKDVDPDEFRFTVNQGGSRVMLANGAWFTVNNTFLRITHSSGYTADYLYAVDADGTLYHNSFQGYERADFRMFKQTANGSDVFAATCGSSCDDEIPKGEGPSLYANMEDGHSTFTPAPCPADGCK